MGEPLHDEQWGLEPWWLQSFLHRSAAWLLCVVYPGYNIPDVSFVEIHVFDASWKRLAKQQFPTGYRMFIKDVELRRLEGFDHDLLAVRTTSAGPFLVRPDGTQTPAFEQGNYQVQFYGWSGERLELLRIEDDEGRLVQNSYLWSSPMKGPDAPALDSEAWLVRLESSDLVQRLAALTWLYSAHYSSDTPRPENVNRSSVESSRRFEAVLASPRLQPLLEKLRVHSHPWVREYASLGTPAPITDR